MPHCLFLRSGVLAGYDSRVSCLGVTEDGMAHRYQCSNFSMSNARHFYVFLRNANAVVLNLLAILFERDL